MSEHKLAQFCFGFQDAMFFFVTRVLKSVELPFTKCSVLFKVFFILVYLYYINSWSNIKSIFEVWSIIKIKDIILCTETCIRLLVTAIFKLGTHTLKDSKTDFEFKPKCCAVYAATSDSWSINSHNTSETCTEHGGSKHVAIYSRNISTTLY